jgi:TetR/AcrR family transcriptional regulator, regulator of cefoperazone and chloramphenicol sensitivity
MATAAGTAHRSGVRRGPGRPGDERTRARLLEAAGRVFADQGFYGATVRETCRRAGVNIAAVNYHFGDKLNLYTEVLRTSINANGAAMKIEPVPDETPEQFLRRFIHVRLKSITGADRPDWAFRLMAHEFGHPTPALTRVVNEVIGPAYTRLRETVGAIIGLPADHETTRLCAHSVIAQPLHFILGRPIIGRLWPELRMTPEQVTRIAEHIADFSLAYLRTFSQARRAGSRGRRR